LRERRYADHRQKKSRRPHESKARRIPHGVKTHRKPLEHKADPGRGPTLSTSGATHFASQSCGFAEEMRSGQ
jgi:hypothetical protein